MYTLLSVHTCDVSGHTITFEAFILEDSRSCIEDSFPNEKRHKEAFEVPCVCFNMLPEVFRQYSEKVYLYWNNYWSNKSCPLCATDLSSFLSLKQ